MNIFKYLFSILALVGVLSQPVVAQGLSADDLGFAFGSDMTSELNAVGYKQSDVVFMTEEEMLATEGKAVWFAPLAWAGVRYAVTGFTRHGLHQTISRGVTSRAITNTLRNPGMGSRSFISGPNAGTTQLRGPGATVVLNRSGQIVSTWRSSRYRPF